MPRIDAGGINSVVHWITYAQRTSFSCRSVGAMRQ